MIYASFNDFLVTSIVAEVLLVILLIVLIMYEKKRRRNSVVSEGVCEVATDETQATVEQFAGTEDSVSQEADSEVEADEAPVKEPTEAPDSQPTTNVVVTMANFGQDKPRERKSFVASLVLNEELQDKYKAVKNEFLSYKKVKSKIYFGYERFTLGRQTLARMVVRGKYLYIYFVLDPASLEPKYHIRDVSHKKIGKKLPSLLRVLSNRSKAYAIQLVAKVMESNQAVRLENPDLESINYDELLKKRSRKQMLDEGLIRKVGAKVEVQPENSNNG